VQSETARKRIAVGITAILSLAIFILALIPVDVPPPIPGTDKLHHLVAFAALTLPCAVLYPRALLWALPVIALEAGLIEMVQPYVNRMREWADFVADMKGIGVGLILGLILRQSSLKLARLHVSDSK
jgi:hypothetical protein